MISKEQEEREKEREKEMEKGIPGERRETEGTGGKKQNKEGEVEPEQT